MYFYNFYYWPFIYQQPICTGSTQLQSHPLQYKRSIQKGEIRSEEEEEEEEG